MHTEARVETDSPARYITRLCKHFRHKAEVRYTDDAGEVDFSFGRCVMAAEANQLTLQAEAGAADALERVQDVIERHLESFAEGQEEWSVEWTAGVER